MQSDLSHKGRGDTFDAAPAQPDSSGCDHALKQASEFGITKGGQKLIALLMEITDVHALGPKETQGLIATDAFYWDMNDETRAFSKRFNEKVGHMPTMIQAGLYSATMHYLKAIEAIGTDEAPKVMAQMRATPINDFFAKNGKIRIDGAWSTTCICLRSRSPRNPRASGISTSCSRPFPATKPSVRSTRADARWSRRIELWSFTRGGIAIADDRSSGEREASWFETPRSERGSSP